MDKKYESGNIAVNAVICTIKDGEILVYLSEREKSPFSGLLEIPGGILLNGETAEETLERKVKEILGIKKIFFRQFHTFTSPMRDPRGRVISIGFISLISADRIRDISQFHKISELNKLAFDHFQIISSALEFLRKSRDLELLRHFLPETFPLNELQSVFEVIEDKKTDNRNFRKKMISSGMVERAKLQQKNVPHRPATLYRFTD